jgi:hypothetical protein
MIHAEIAAGTDLPLGTVKGRMRLGLEKLHSGFADQVRAASTAAWPPLRLAPPPAVEREPAQRTRADVCARRAA